MIWQTKQRTTIIALIMHKIFRLSALVLVALFLCIPCRGFPAAINITSPDHPPAWYNRAGDKVNEELDWRREDQELILKVSYNSVPYIHPGDQLLYDTFTVAFPQVRFDGATNRLYVLDHNRKVTIGRMTSGAFGMKPTLDHGLVVSAHRHNGMINAQITYESNR